MPTTSSGCDSLAEEARVSKSAFETVKPEVDAVLLDLWNQIEAYFASEPPEVRYAECRKLGVVYYYRRKEPHLY